MGVLPGPFKIVLQGLERSSSPDTLGDPTAARVRVEVGRLFQLDDETASNIVSAVPIVIVDGLDARAAGVVRDRMQVLRDAGCRVVITDEVTDTIPRVNWPQLPPIARVDPASDERRGGGGHGEGLACPHCGGGLQVLPAGSGPNTGHAGRSGAPMNGREPQREPEPTPAAPPMPAPREREREAARPARADDDWLSPPVGASAAPPPPPSTSRRSGRFDDAALLGYRSKQEPEPRRASTTSAQPVASAPVASATATSDLLDVSFSDSSEVDPPLAPEPRRPPPPPPPADEPRNRRSPPPAPVKAEPEPSLLDSEDDRPRSKTATTTTKRPGAPEKEKPPESKPEKPFDGSRSNSKSRVSDPFEDSLGGLDPAPVQAPKRGADPFASGTAKRASALDTSSARSSTASDPFEDSRLMEDLANDLGAGGSPDPLDDSGSDILDQLPPHRRKDAPEPKKGGGGGDARFESDLDLLDEGSPDLGDSDERPRAAPAATPKRGAPAVSAPRKPLGSSSHDLGDSDDPDDDGLSLLDSGEAAPPPPPAAKKKEKEKEKEREKERPGRGAKGPDLDEVLNMFGPEDGAPLDDGSGLEPAPLDLSPPQRGAAAKPARAPGGGRDRGFDAELSDILEPLDPGEALEIIKTSNPKPGRRPSAGGAASGMNGRHSEEPSGLEQLDDGEASAVVADEPKPDKRAAAKKSRGVPFPASDEDVGLFEDSSRGTRGQKKKTDPFARARGRLAEEDEREKRSGADRAGSDRGGADRNERSDRNERPERSERPERNERGSGADRSGSERQATAEPRGRTESRPQKRGGGAGAGGPPPSGDGEHGLVLSRIADPEKKEQAAEIIAEVKGCNMDEARRLTDRTIIPVLKGVSREVAEFHLEKFKRVKIAGRVTTRQRG